jgi:hypothetical protein
VQTGLLSQTSYDIYLPWAVLAVLLALFVLVGQKASPKDVKLSANAGYKFPMLALELNAGKAQEIFETWDEVTINKFRAALMWDYLFLFIYPAAIAVSCFIAARFLDLKGILAFKYGLLVMCLQLVAAVSDAAENFLLLKVLNGSPETAWPQVARWCAILKFSLIGVGVFYTVIFGCGGWLITFINRSR